MKRLLVKHLLVAGLMVVALIASAQPASACATCFGAEDSGLTKGMNGAIMTLLALVGVVQFGFVAMFAGFIIRSKRLREHKDRFRLIRGGTP